MKTPPPSLSGPNFAFQRFHEPPSLREKAQEFEAVFISEWLRLSGISEGMASGGGNGAEAFSSFLLEEYAKGLADKGGFGLADKIYRQLKDHEKNEI